MGSRFDEESDISDSEFNEYKQTAYKLFKFRTYKIRGRNDKLRCPFCADTEELDYQYTRLLQHAIRVAEAEGSGERRKQRASHSAMAMYLVTDVADEVEPPPQSMNVLLQEKEDGHSDHEELTNNAVLTEIKRRKELEARNKLIERHVFKLRRRFRHGGRVIRRRKDDGGTGAGFVAPAEGNKSPMTVAAEDGATRVVSSSRVEEDAGLVKEEMLEEERAYLPHSEPEWSWKRPAWQGVSARINIYNRFPTFSIIREELQTIGREVYQQFTSSCFGHFMHFQDDGNSCNTAIHAILSREITKAGAPNDELWFSIGRQLIRFSKPEYALVTGLRFGESNFRPDDVHFPQLDGVHVRYFGGGSVTIDRLRTTFRDGRFRDSPADALKVAKVLFLYTWLLGMDEKKTLIDTWVWVLIEDTDGWENFPWGKYTYDHLLHYIKQQVPVTPREGNRVSAYHLYGFSTSLMIWAYEAIPALGKKCGEIVFPNRTPRCLRWRFPRGNKDLKEFFTDQLVCYERLHPSPEEQAKDYWISVGEAPPSDVQHAVEGRVPMLIVGTCAPTMTAVQALRSPWSTNSRGGVRKRQRTGLSLADQSGKGDTSTIECPTLDSHDRYDDQTVPMEYADPVGGYSQDVADVQEIPIGTEPLEVAGHDAGTEPLEAVGHGVADFHEIPITTESLGVGGHDAVDVHEIPIITEPLGVGGHNAADVHEMPISSASSGRDGDDHMCAHEIPISTDFGSIPRQQEPPVSDWGTFLRQLMDRLTPLILQEVDRSSQTALQRHVDVCIVSSLERHIPLIIQREVSRAFSELTTPTSVGPETARSEDMRTTCDAVRGLVG